MQKYTFFIILCFAFSASSFANGMQNINDNSHEELQVNEDIIKTKHIPVKWSRCSFAFKPAYYRPQSSVFRRIYDCRYITLLEIDARLYKIFRLWLETGFYSDKDQVEVYETQIDTKILQIPLSLGVSCTYVICSYFDIFAKFGPNWVYTKTWDRATGLKVIEKDTFGYTVGIGSNFKINKYLFLQLFFNYLWDKKTVHDPNSAAVFKVSLGGIQTGMGLGCRF